jgi:hypothetical protein
MESASFIGDDGSNNNIAIKLCQELFTIPPKIFSQLPFTKGGLGGFLEVDFQNGSSLQNLESLNIRSTEGFKLKKPKEGQRLRIMFLGYIG